MVKRISAKQIKIVKIEKRANFLMKLLRKHLAKSEIIKQRLVYVSISLVEVNFNIVYLEEMNNTKKTLTQLKVQYIIQQSKY